MSSSAEKLTATRSETATMAAAKQTILSGSGMDSKAAATAPKTEAQLPSDKHAIQTGSIGNTPIGGSGTEQTNQSVKKRADAGDWAEAEDEVGFEVGESFISVASKEIDPLAEEQVTHVTLPGGETITLPEVPLELNRGDTTRDAESVKTVGVSNQKATKLSNETHERHPQEIRFDGASNISLIGNGLTLHGDYSPEIFSYQPGTFLNHDFSQGKFDINIEPRVGSKHMTGDNGIVLPSNYVSDFSTSGGTLPLPDANNDPPGLWSREKKSDRGDEKFGLEPDGVFRHDFGQKQQYGSPIEQTFTGESNRAFPSSSFSGHSVKYESFVTPRVRHDHSNFHFNENDWKKGSNEFSSSPLPASQLGIFASDPTTYDIVSPAISDYNTFSSKSQNYSPSNQFRVSTSYAQLKETPSDVSSMKNSIDLTRSQTEFSNKYLPGNRFMSDNVVSVPSAVSRDDMSSFETKNEWQGRDFRLLSDCTPEENDIDARLAMLNAKSRAFRELLGPTCGVGSASASISSNHKFDLGIDYDSTLIDARLEILNNNLGHDSTENGKSEKKGVTFSETCVTRDDTGRDRSVLTKTESRKAAVEAVLKGKRGKSATADAVSGKEETVENSNGPSQGDSVNFSLHKSLATKILSEKILSGFKVLHSHCERCGTSLLTKNAKIECGFCPVMEMRTYLHGYTSKRVLAARILQGCDLSGSLCQQCHSPTLAKDGKVVCDVCTVLDEICLSVVCKLSRGGSIQDTKCDECGSRRVKDCKGVVFCNVCPVLNSLVGTGPRISGDLSISPSEQKSKDDTGTTSDAVSRTNEETKEALNNQKLTFESSGKVSKTNEEITEAPNDQKPNPQSTEHEAVVIEHTNQIKNNAMIKPTPSKEVMTDQVDVDKMTEPWSVHCCKPMTSASEAPKSNNESEAPKGNQIALSEKEVTLLKKKLKSEADKAERVALSLQRTDVVDLQEELMAELLRAKQCQAQLEKIIGDATTSVPNEKGNSIEEEEDLALSGRSFSISQREVEAGVPKDYIPPPTFFRSGIPSTVKVDHLPDESVAQSYHTKNLKNSETRQTRATDCFGMPAAANNVKIRGNDGFDDETIETDEFTVDYTLNTYDASRTGRVRFHDPSVKEYDDDEASPSVVCCHFTHCFGYGEKNGKPNEFTEEKQGILLKRLQSETTRQNQTRGRMQTDGHIQIESRDESDDSGNSLERFRPSKKKVYSEFVESGSNAQYLQRARNMKIYEECDSYNVRNKRIPDSSLHSDYDEEYIPRNRTGNSQKIRMAKDAVMQQEYGTHYGRYEYNPESNKYNDGQVEHKSRCRAEYPHTSKNKEESEMHVENTADWRMQHGAITKDTSQHRKGGPPDLPGNKKGSGDNCDKYDVPLELALTQAESELSDQKEEIDHLLNKLKLGNPPVTVIRQGA